MSDTQVIPYQSGDVPDCMPAVSIAQLLQRRQMFVEFMGQLMRPSAQGSADGDYGIIPGAKKPTLLKPGAEKLCNFFGLVPNFEVVEKIEDWSGDMHGGEPLFAYTYKCSLLKRGMMVGSGDGHCNSREVKYRYRQGERLCPACGKPAIIKGKEEYGGGWLCFPKKEGCGAKWPDGAQEIEGQQVGRVINPDIADLINTLIKMAQKRALVAAVLVTTSASEFYTQDLEDMQQRAEAAAAHPQARAQQAEHPMPQRKSENGHSERISEAQRKRMYAIGKNSGHWTDEAMKKLLKANGFEHSEEVTRDKYEAICKALEQRPAAAQEQEALPI